MVGQLLLRSISTYWTYVRNILGKEMCISFHNIYRFKNPRNKGKCHKCLLDSYGICLCPFDKITLGKGSNKKPQKFGALCKYVNARNY